VFFFRNRRETLRNSIIAALALTVLTVPGLAQAQADAPTSGTMTAADAGASPMTGTTPANYAAWAADSDLYEIQSSKLALSRSKSPAVKTLAREMIADHTTTTKALMAALPKTSPRVPKPPMTLSADNAAMIDQLKQASGSAFDAMYMQQQLQAHQKAWALHKGFATDGADPALQQVAASAVPIIEKHLQHLKSAPAGGMSGM
jgi:putative membrane protein